MAQVWNWTWLTVAFLAELAALAALAVWGWSAGGSTALRVLLAVGRAGGRRRALGRVRRAAGAGAGRRAHRAGEGRRLRRRRRWRWSPPGTRGWPSSSAAAALLSSLLSTPPAPAGRADLQQQAPDEGRPHAAGQVDLPAGHHPGVHARGARAAPMTSSSTCSQTRRSPAVAGGTGEPGRPHQVLVQHRAARAAEHLPVEVRPQRQRPAADLRRRGRRTGGPPARRAARAPPSAGASPRGARGECCSACQRVCAACASPREAPSRGSASATRSGRTSAIRRSSTRQNSRRARPRTRPTLPRMLRPVLISPATAAGHRGRVGHARLPPLGPAPRAARAAPSAPAPASSGSTRVEEVDPDTLTEDDAAAGRRPLAGRAAPAARPPRRARTSTGCEVCLAGADPRVALREQAELSDGRPARRSTPGWTAGTPPGGAPVDPGGAAADRRATRRAGARPRRLAGPGDAAVQARRPQAQGARADPQPRRSGMKSHPAGGPTWAEPSGRIEAVTPRTAATAFRIVAVAEALLLGRPAGRHVREVRAPRPPSSACRSSARSTARSSSPTSSSRW